MTCAELRTQLWEYYDQACAPVLRAEVERHLAGCPGCQKTLDDWIALSSSIFEGKRALKAPPFLWTRVLAGIESQEQDGAGAWWYQWRWMSRVAGVLTLVVGLGAAYLFHEASGSFDGLLEGQPTQHDALRVATLHGTDADAGAALALGEID